MAKTLRNFKVHGAFKSKKKAVSREKSKACHGECFIITRMVRKAKRYIVLERK